jgi:hypothetical protein
MEDASKLLLAVAKAKAGAGLCGFSSGFILSAGNSRYNAPRVMLVGFKKPRYLVRYYHKA